ncbi:unnamed protein product [Chrysoparadoxa australica]
MNRVNRLLKAPGPKEWCCRSLSSANHPLSTHLSSDGGTPRMVDVGEKEVTLRTASAQARVLLPEAVTSKMRIEGGEVMGEKGPIFTTAIIAGVQASKRTSELIPFCHTLLLDDCKVDVRLDADSRGSNQAVIIDCTVKTCFKTGVEMEALMGASVAALTVYDMLKGLSHDIVVENTRLMSKSGGKRTFSRSTEIER